ncbi:outer membrane beta-barrel protein [bacterium]|nr:outer membrane beta-barrel protein [bacterium]
MSRFKLLYSALFLGIGFGIQAQTQTVKGTVLDAQAAYPLVGASVVVMGTTPILGGATDAEGRFRIEKVPIGRHTLVVTLLGYKSQTIPNVVVTAGKEVVLNIELVESVEALNEVVVKAESPKERPLNEMAKVSARTFSLEEVTRYSGGRNDVARLVTSFAGVSAANDSRNDIVVRGNAPTGLLWRVEGLPIATTNHFSTFGTTGGPVSALNTNLLKTSDFLTGAFPAEYGNANAAVFDVQFRDGNTDTYEFTAQMSAFSGLEAMAEGPISKKNQSSFLVSYRYGIASLAATGTSAIPYYQDLSFKLNFGQSKWGRFSLFGLGGRSSIDFLGDEISEDDLFADPNSNAFVASELGMIGLSHNIRLGEKSYLKSTVGVVTVGNTYTQDNLIRDTVSGATLQSYRATNLDDSENRYTLSTQFNQKFSPRLSLRAGGMVEFFQIKSELSNRDNEPSIPDNDDDGIPDYFIPLRSVDTLSPLAQVYAQADYKFTDRLGINAGVHAQYLDYTGNFFAGPRTALSWEVRPKQRWTLAYGLHAQMVPLPILTDLNEIAPGVFEATNNQLDFIKSHHFVLGYDWGFAESWRVKAEAYYQRIFDAPIEALPTSYSVLNEGSSFVFDSRPYLVNKGMGSNVGMELTLEKFFSKNYYLLATASFFDSRYEGGDGIERQTAFNNQYVLNALFGRELPLNPRIALTFDTKLTTSGGRPYTPIDLEATRQNGGREVLLEDQAFSERYDPYFRWDVKFGFRLNGKKGKITQQFFVDLQNVTNRKNIFEERYNEVTDQIDPVYQIGFFPDVLYRVQF